MNIGDSMNEANASCNLIALRRATSENPRNQCFLVDYILSQLIMPCYVYINRLMGLNFISVLSYIHLIHFALVDIQSGF